MPEVREVTPGHLVRSGGSSAFDVNFGYEAGAAAVALLASGISGRTVVSVEGNRITHMATEKAIVHREVDVSGLPLWESLGTCFGREPVPFTPELVEPATLPIPRHL
jgi:6-phosphofructokinase 1